MCSLLMIAQLILPRKAIKSIARAAVVETAVLLAKQIMDLSTMTCHLGTTTEVLGAAWMDAGETC